MPDPGEYITRFPQFRCEVDSQFSLFQFGPDVDSRKETIDSTIELGPTRRRSAAVPPHAEEYRDQLVSRPPRPLRTIDDSIDPELEHICLKCLEKPMADRFTTCYDLATALQEYLQVSDGVVGTGSQPRHAAQFTRRARLLAAAFAVIGLAGFGVWIFAFGFSGSRVDQAAPGIPGRSDQSAAPRAGAEDVLLVPFGRPRAAAVRRVAAPLCSPIGL